jgi:hypothetical protein
MKTNNKMLDLLVDMNNHIIEGLVDIRALMSNITVNMNKELGIMHLEVLLKSYKITSNAMIQVMNKINKLLVYLDEVVHKMEFTMVDTDGINVLLALDFLIKIRIVVNIQVRHGLSVDVKILPLNMVTCCKCWKKVK